MFEILLFEPLGCYAYLYFYRLETVLLILSILTKTLDIFVTEK